MNRRMWKGVATSVFLLLVPSVTGCASLRHGLRGETPEKAAEAASGKPDGTPDRDVALDVQSPTPKPFFKSSRLPGGLSDEGRDIERDLGIR